MNTNRETQPYNTNDTAEQSVPELLKEPVDTSEASDQAPDSGAPGSSTGK
jgi:hypothetical protein